MSLMILYVPFVAGLAMLVVLFAIWLKGIRSYSNVVVWLAAGVSVAQLFTGLFLTVAPPEEQPGIGVVLIVMAVITVIATSRVYNSMRGQMNNSVADPTKKIAKMITDYNDELIRTTDIVERNRIKHQIDKLKGDLKS